MPKFLAKTERCTSMIFFTFLGTTFFTSFWISLPSSSFSMTCSTTSSLILSSISLFSLTKNSAK